MVSTPAAKKVWRAPLRRPSAPIRWFIPSSLKMTRRTDAWEGLGFPVAEGWAADKEEDNPYVPRSLARTAKKFWNGFPSRAALACLKFPKNYLSKKSTGKLKMSCGANTAWATHQIKRLPKLAITRSILRPRRRIWWYRPATDITSNGK